MVKKLKIVVSVVCLFIAIASVVAMRYFTEGKSLIDSLPYMIIAGTISMICLLAIKHVNRKLPETLEELQELYDINPGKPYKKLIFGKRDGLHYRQNKVLKIQKCEKCGSTNIDLFVIPYKGYMCHDCESRIEIRFKPVKKAV